MTRNCLWISAAALLAVPVFAQEVPSDREQTIVIRPATPRPAAIPAIPNPPVPTMADHRMFAIEEPPMLVLDGRPTPGDRVAILRGRGSRNRAAGSRVGGFRQSVRMRRPAR